MRDIPAGRQRNTRRGRSLAECSWPGPSAGDAARSACGPGAGERRQRGSPLKYQTGNRIACQYRRVPEDPILVGPPTGRVVASTPGWEWRFVAANRIPEVLREVPGMLLVRGFRGHARRAVRCPVRTCLVWLNTANASPLCSREFCTHKHEIHSSGQILQKAVFALDEPAMARVLRGTPSRPCAGAVNPRAIRAHQGQAIRANSLDSRRGSARLPCPSLDTEPMDHRVAQHRIVGRGSITTLARCRGAEVTMYFQHPAPNVVTTRVRQITRV
jgi:hypothetical protein